MMVIENMIKNIAELRIRERVQQANRNIYSKQRKACKWLKITLSVFEWLASVATIVGLSVSIRVCRQTQSIHDETLAINENMRRIEYIRYARENIDKYLMKPWHDMAIQTSNNLNDSLRAWGMEPDSTCYNYFIHRCNSSKEAGNIKSLQISEKCLKQLR